jgi:large subunit ribosomal protein L16
MPKRVKFRKSGRGVVRGRTTRKKYHGVIKGFAHRGNYVAYGDFGLQSLEGGWLSAECIESGRITMTRFVSGEGRYYIRVFPHKPVTSIPAETRMGKGKGEPEYWAAVSGSPPISNRIWPGRVQDAVQVPVRDPPAQCLVMSNEY